MELMAFSFLLLAGLSFSRRQEGGGRDSWPRRKEASFDLFLKSAFCRAKVGGDRDKRWTPESYGCRIFVEKEREK